eukprot:941692-Amphidinium_carterae.1
MKVLRTLVMSSNAQQVLFDNFREPLTSTPTILTASISEWCLNLGEGVQVHDHEVNWPYAMLLHLTGMLFASSCGEQASMDLSHAKL